LDGTDRVPAVSVRERLEAAVLAGQAGDLDENTFRSHVPDHPVGLSNAHGVDLPDLVA
jgi:hypothetical protein